MKVSNEAGTPTVLCLFLLFFLPLARAILSGYEYTGGVLTIPKYGCQWSGGSAMEVNCSCRSDAEEFVIEENQIEQFDLTSIYINNCKKVIMAENSIQNLRNLRLLQFNNIPSLTFEKSSLVWYGYTPQFGMEMEDNIPAMTVKIENCVVENIAQYAFKGSLKEIDFLDSTVKNMEAFAFSSLQYTYSVIFKNTDVYEMKPQAFKSFATKNFKFENVTVNTIPSRGISGITVREYFLIKDCHFENIRPSGFLVYDTERFEIVGNQIYALDGEAFVVSTKGSVLVRDNTIDVINDIAFKKITKSPDLYTSPYITFDSNTFSILSRNSLEVVDLIPKILNLRINESCDCDRILTRVSDYADFYSEIKCVDDSGEYVSINDYKNEMCTIVAGYTKMLIIIGAVLAALLLVAIAFGVFYFRFYKTRKYGNKKNVDNKNISLIVPDGRTYRETELHVIVERADLLTTDL